MGETSQKALALFIHGFGSSGECWKSLLGFLRQNPAITALYELKTWDYPTKWIELNIAGRIPRLEEIAEKLQGDLGLPEYRNREITLVGHSQGGLVIQTYFAVLLKDQQANRLRKIRQAIFIATPTEGSTTAMSARLLLSTLFTNPQELALRVHNPECADTRRRVREHIVGATRDSATEWRVPIHAIYGLQDSVVPESSAKGVFDNTVSVPGNHFSVLQPTKNGDGCYPHLTQLLLEPGGHTHRFEVKNYEVSVRIEPNAEKTITVSDSKGSHLVTYDNYALMTRRICFAASNRCRDSFAVSYATNKLGYLVGRVSLANEAPVLEQGRAKRSGTYFRFDFTPETEKEYTVEVEVDIFNGFPPSEYDVHFHPSSYNSRLWRLSYELDLSAFLAAGYVFSTAPACYVQPKDVECGELCRQRRHEHFWPADPGSPEGVYRWTLPDTPIGVVDLVWDFAPKAAALIPATALPADQ